MKLIFVFCNLSVDYTEEKRWVKLSLFIVFKADSCCSFFGLSGCVIEVLLSSKEEKPQEHGQTA